MKKILFLIHTLRGGGAESALIRLVNEMNKNKYDITVIAVINTGKYIKELDEQIKYKYIFDEIIDTETMDRKNIIHMLKYMKLKFYYKYYWKIANIKKLYKKHIKEKYDIEVAFLEGITAKIISNSDNVSSKKIAWIHTDLTRNKNTKRFFKSIQEERDCYYKFNKIVCVSDNVKNKFIEELQLKSYRRVIVRHNPLDINKIINNSNENYEEIESKIKTNDEKIVCSIGRLEKVKGYDRLIECHKKLIENNIKHKLIILGQGSEYNNLNKYIVDNKLQDTVTLLGYMDNPYPYIKASDIYICSSICEGLNISVCEAMVLGKPVIVTKGIGFKSILGENSEHGLIVENSKEGIYDGLKLLLTSPDIMKKYSEESLKTSTAFDLKTNLKKIEQLF